MCFFLCLRLGTSGADGDAVTGTGRAVTGTGRAVTGTGRAVGLLALQRLQQLFHCRVVAFFFVERKSKQPLIDAQHKSIRI